jgi:hypothetical protein
MYKDPDPGRQALNICRSDRIRIHNTGFGDTGCKAKPFRKKLLTNIPIIFENEIASLFATITGKETVLGVP